MKDEKEKLEIRKKSQGVKKEDLEKVAGGDTGCLPSQGIDNSLKCNNTVLC